MGFRLWAIVAGFAALLAILAAPRTALADDAAVSAAVARVLNDDFANANFGDARRKLKALADKCNRKPQCGASAVAEVHVAMGMVAAQLGKDDEARQDFTTALDTDAAAALPTSVQYSDQVKKAFAEAQKAWIAAHPQPDDATKAGWQNKAAFDLAAQAAAADQAGNYAECIQKERAALQLEEQARARLHLATCEQKSGKVIDALRDAQKALEGAAQKKDIVVAKSAQVKLAELLPKIAHVTFEVTQTVGGLKLTFDERPIPNDKLTQSFSIDPGQHKVHAEGSVSGILMSFDQTIDVKEGETAKVDVRLKPTALTPGQLECMLKAKTEEEIRACLPKQEKPLVVRAALENSIYSDTMAVNVYSPAIHGEVVSPTGGWNVGASYTLDVLTAASPDVVSTASRRFEDVRNAFTANGGFKPGAYGGQAVAFVSNEKDYSSMGAGLTLTGDFLEKQLTPSLGFTYSQDHVGRTAAQSGAFFPSFDTVSTFSTLEMTGGATIVLSPVSILVIGGTIQLERGDQSKPYRYIPMFDPTTAGTITAGEGITQVNDARLPIRPLEHLPTERDRYAVAARYALRTMGGRATLRLEERLYTDSWQLRATTTDARLMYDLTRHLVVWPHVHVHAQTGAAFYKLAYTASLNPDGSVNLPADRTTDRELSPLIGVTGGGGTRIALTQPESKVQLGISVQADAMYTRYFNALFVKARLAGYGTLGIDGEFE